jgi:hypothetical protein
MSAFKRGKTDSTSNYFEEEGFCPDAFRVDSSRPIYHMVLVSIRCGLAVVC